MDLSKVAFIDVDTQHDFMDESGNLYVPGAKDLKENLRRLVEKAVLEEIPLIATADAHSEDDPEFDIFPPHCMKGTFGQTKIPETTVDEMVALAEKEKTDIDFFPERPVLVESSVFSMFNNVNAEAVIEKTGKKEFVVFGVATDYCVKEAVEGLLKRGYSVYLVTDAISAVDPTNGEKVLSQFQWSGVKLIKTEDVLK